MIALVNERLIFVGVSAIIIILSAVNFQQQLAKINDGASPFLHDRSQLAAIKTAVRSIPPNEVIVATSQAPIISYFTGYQTIVPYGVKSAKELDDFMAVRNATYLLVFENRTSEGVYKPLFGTSGLANLDANFTRLGEYHSDHSKIFLLERKGASG